MALEDGQQAVSGTGGSQHLSMHLIATLGVRPVFLECSELSGLRSPVRPGIGPGQML